MLDRAGPDTGTSRASETASARGRAGRIFNSRKGFFGPSRAERDYEDAFKESFKDVCELYRTWKVYFPRGFKWFHISPKDVFLLPFTGFELSASMDK